MKRVEKSEDYMRAEIRCDIKNSGMTQEQWAQQMGFSAQFICDVLAGRRNVTDSLAAAMDYERVVLFRRTTSTQASSAKGGKSE